MCRPSTTLPRSAAQVVDGRDKPGHDTMGTAVPLIRCLNAHAAARVWPGSNRLMLVPRDDSGVPGIGGLLARLWGSQVFTIAFWTDDQPRDPQAVSTNLQFPQIRFLDRRIAPQVPGRAG